ncbi:hypothetical protein DPMN_092998 [Dreissena polymorpha]|uniref:Uncharacterized protein n=1 Tax=Dreissena polymorpha TaxID=45954 RepID=A0A9D4R0J2_DREPO|nr:hypothetical protein DPMN_092998 [Dreissena polymorpha]
MHHGKNGSSANVNICDGFQTVVENDDFLPETVTWRRWINMSMGTSESYESTYKNKRPYRHSHDYDDATDDI